ncbi:hypothetical protein JCM17844_03160 [Iodidimonas gelatinilytica]|uniref:Uncharacterized protein n=1 Tax=Iodidimonas gelatinilytica TaxID=1236966 RepID=A0A5A7MPA7_9PROT|nr:hypothetical protein JCM17844_03160 [Iodidimonas gelatinilytica]
MIARLVRKAVKEIVEGKRKRVQVTVQNLAIMPGCAAIVMAKRKRRIRWA